MRRHKERVFNYMKRAEHSSGNCKCYREISAFTVVELMVVVSIILILMTILMPALYKSKQTAHKLLCAGNLKQIGLAFSAYTNDYNNYFPVCRQYNPNVYWYLHLLPPYINELKVGYRDLSKPGQKSLYCPSQKIESGVSIYYSYGYNNLVYNANGSVAVDASHNMFIPLLVTQAKTPSETCLSGDSILPDIYYNVDASVGTRHTNSANILFIDGHVKACQYLEIPKSAANIFWRPR